MTCMYKNMRTFTFLLIVLLASSGLFAQNPAFSYERQPVKKYPLGASINASQLNTDYRPVLQNLEAPYPGGTSYRDILEAKKAAIKADFEPTGVPAGKTSGTATEPTLAINFQGNDYFSGVPNDNDMAIGMDAMLISVINSNMFVFNGAFGNKVMDVSLQNFSDTLNLPASKYDPKVQYDPEQDRYIMLYLSGFTDSTNNIVVAFSHSNDPAGGWNLYSLPGNPLNDTTWTDYPMFTITPTEIFITGNAIRTGQSWQAGFRQTYIWQIDKRKGYAGDSLTTQLWTNVAFGGKSIRNLRPVQGGQGLYGPKLYLLSNRNFDTTNDTIFLLELSDSIGGNASLTVNALKTTPDYGVPPNGRQKFNQSLATNDGRILGAFHTGDKIQFVSNSADPQYGYAAIYHGTISNLGTGTPAVSGLVINDSILDFAYPNISNMSISTGGQEALISFVYNEPDSFPGMKAIYYDGNGNYSCPVTIRKGNNFINVLTGSSERWGDYSGSQIMYNKPGHVWVSGGFATSNRVHGTWIAELVTPLIVGQEEPVTAPAERLEIAAGPVPAREYVSLEFELPEARVLNISLFDAAGRLVKLFHRDLVKQGRNRFTISTAEMEAGVYYLRVQELEGRGEVAVKKIVVVR